MDGTLSQGLSYSCTGGCYFVRDFIGRAQRPESKRPGVIEIFIDFPDPAQCVLRLWGVSARRDLRPVLA